MKLLGGMSAEERPAAGQAINKLKQSIQQRIEDALVAAESAAQRHEIETGQEDGTLPSRRPWSGSLHPITHTWREMERIFRDMKLAEIYEGVNEIQRVIAAAELLR